MGYFRLFRHLWQEVVREIAGRCLRGHGTVQAICKCEAVSSEFRSSRNIKRSRRGAMQVTLLKNQVGTIHIGNRSSKDIQMIQTVKESITVGIDRNGRERTSGCNKRIAGVSSKSDRVIP